MKYTATSIKLTFGIGYLLEEKRYCRSSLGGMKRVTVRHFQSIRPYHASLPTRNSALLLFALVQMGGADTIVGQDHRLKRVHAAVEQQRRRVKLRNIWVRPIIYTRAALMDLELASNVVNIEEEMMARVVVTFALIILTTAVLLGMNREDAQSLDTRCLKVVNLVPGAGVVHINVVRLLKLYRLELHVVVTFALILVMTAVPLGAKRADAQSLDTRCLKVVLLVPAGCLVQMLYTNVVRLLYRMELHPMVSSV